jgi:Protein of unknown function (DUF3631)
VKLDDLDTPLDGAALLDELHTAFARYVVLPSPEATDAVVLWTAATHAQPAWEHATRLDATSPEKRCGKSRLLDVIEATSHAPLITVNISAAALARSVGDDPPTLILDEADTVFGKGIKGDEKAETLRGLINAGHQRNRPYIRWDPASRRPENCPTFAMAALAGIGTLPDTITDRAVIIRMRRRAPDETVAAFRIRRDTPPLHDLRDRITAWVRANLDELREAVPGDMPVDDRAYDNWTPLVAIADFGGAEWPKRARKAAEVLTAEADKAAIEASLSLRLLADLAEVFGEPHSESCPTDCDQHVTKLATSAILSSLRGLDEAPWGDLHGKPIDSRALAKLLRPYDVSSKVIRVGESTPRGYDRADLHEAWARYTPGVRNKRNMQNIAGQSVADDNRVADVSATAQQAQPADQARCAVADVADTPPARAACTICGEPLDQSYIDAGFTDHGENT